MGSPGLGLWKAPVACVMTLQLRTCCCCGGALLIPIPGGMIHVAPGAARGAGTASAPPHHVKSGFAFFVHQMGNAVATGAPTPHSPSPLLRLRKGKKNGGCPCFLADGASTWESITENPKFRSYVLRHLLDEGFISSILEHGEREHALTACGGVPYYEVRDVLAPGGPTNTLGLLHSCV